MFKDGSEMAGNGHCFSGADKDRYTCHGITLKNSSCDVYKCEWFKYYKQDPPDCAGLKASCGQKTTANDPDFYRPDTPATGYLSEDDCEKSCVDPTVACVDGICRRTGTCDPTSYCSKECGVSLPEVMQGLQVNNNYTSELWNFTFALTDNQRAYTAMNVSGPSGALAQYTVQTWSAGDGTTFNATLVLHTADKTEVHAARFDIGARGAYGKNVYVAICPHQEVCSFGEVMFMKGGQEFALLGCQYKHEHAVSGQDRPIDCKVGSLH